MIEKKRKRGISIQWKIFAYLLGFCAILLLLLWLFQTVFLDSFYKSIKIKQVEDAAKTVSASLDGDISDVIEEISARFDASIEILDENGVSLYSSSDLENNVIYELPYQQKMSFLDTILEKGEIFGYYDMMNFRKGQNGQFDFNDRPMPLRKNENETLLYGKKLTDSEGNIRILIINSVISPVDATVEALRIQLYFVSLFMLLFSVVLAVIITKKVSKPIEKLNDSAKVLAQGKYDVSFAVKGYREISELSGTLTYAAGELSKVDKLRRELIANISHDLRTPLTLIKGYSEAMRDLPDENTPENAQIIIDETQRLTTLVNDVLDLSKLQSGTQRIDPEPFDLTEMLRAVIHRLGKLVGNEDYKIMFEDSDDVTVTADEPLISQVFYNLLINAVNYTGDDKTVVVKQKVSEKEVTVEVCDSGEGIPEENVPYIWERYYKSDKNHRRGVAGTGLGLSIVKSVTELHGGKYGVRPGESGGSVFWFSLLLCGNENREKQ